MNRLTHGQLFGGIFGLAAQWAGIKNVWYNEIEHYPCEVVRARIADGSIIDQIEIYEEDIRQIGKHNLESVDIISGGVPCQPASVAGKRKGTDDDRWLWPEAIRIIQELKPTFAVFENPPGILSLENGKSFQQILLALENEGYTLEIYNIPACSLRAWHKRERIWIVATLENCNLFRCSSSKRKEKSGPRQFRKSSTGDLQRLPNKEITSNSNSKRRCSRDTSREDAKNVRELRGSEEYGVWDVEPKLGRVVHGIPRRVDRLKGLGNAIVPQVAYEIFKAIQSIEDGKQV